MFLTHFPPFRSPKDSVPICAIVNIKATGGKNNVIALLTEWVTNWHQPNFLAKSVSFTVIKKQSAGKQLH